VMVLQSCRAIFSTDMSMPRLSKVAIFSEWRKSCTVSCDSLYSSSAMLSGVISFTANISCGIFGSSVGVGRIVRGVLPEQP